MTRPSPAHDDNSFRALPAGGPRIRSDIVDVYIFQRASTPPRPVVGASAVSSSWGGTTSDSGADPAREVYFLQLHRTRDPLGNTWQPVMGHCEKGETAVQCALREMAEEVGLAPLPRGRGQGGGSGGGAVGEGRESAVAPPNRAQTHFQGLWALEQVHPFFIAELDAIVMSPRLAAEVSPGWSPRINDEHAAYRWVHYRDAVRPSGDGAFMWPGQRSAAREIVESLLPEGSVSLDRLRVK